MCGIAGYIGKSSIDKPRIFQTLDLMKNRGPDHRDYMAMEENSMHILLLHARLSIIDGDERSNQPFTIGDYTLIFNGEIYNYKELRDYLKKEGVKFRTESDTEVLLQSYISHGEKCVNDFEGMWSFAIYDRKEKKLFLSRDRFREKPLYLYETSEGIFFASEVKFLRSLAGVNFSVNLTHAFRYLTNGYKSLYKTDDTFFHGIRELSFASSLVVDHNLQCVSYKYWSPTYNPKEIVLEKAVEGFRHHLLESIRIRLRSDVPIAFCLSGGIDSSAIASIAAKHFGYDVAAFSIIDSDERYNEYDNIQATVADLHCSSTMLDIPQNGAFERLERLVRYHDAPLATITFFIHSLLSEAISRSGYRVAVSGLGADEMVSGYYDHYILHLYEMRNHPNYQDYLSSWRKHVSHFVRNPHLKNPELYFDRPNFRDHIYLNNDFFAGFLKTDFREDFVETYYCNSLLRNRMMNELFNEAVPVSLHDDDLNSMFYSVENRSPYLDSRLFDFAYSIPNEYLIRDGYNKYILREAVRGILNDTVRLNRRKQGFNAAINSLFDFSKKTNVDYALSDGIIFEYVDRNKIAELITKMPMPNSFSKFLFNFLNLKIFLDINSQPNRAQDISSVACSHE